MSSVFTDASTVEWATHCGAGFIALLWTAYQELRRWQAKKNGPSGKISDDNGAAHY